MCLCLCICRPVCVHAFISDIFMNHRGQPTEQAGFADCSYFESPSSAEFAPAPSPVVTTPPQLLINPQLAQVRPEQTSTAIWGILKLAQFFTNSTLNNVMHQPTISPFSNSLSPRHLESDHSKPNWTQDANTSPRRTLCRTTPIPTMTRLLL